MGMGRGQAVRQQVLILLFGGSNPSVPDLFHWFLFSLPSLFPFFFRKG
uniref:ORF47d n=1 Tax=Pinus koraiensis TaxID=88728 RepID=Q85X74_PINKO|nr:ORF47d [Pinus koraiensis]